MIVVFPNEGKIAVRIKMDKIHNSQISRKLKDFWNYGIRQNSSPASPLLIGRVKRQIVANDCSEIIKILKIGCFEMFNIYSDFWSRNSMQFFPTFTKLNNRHKLAPIIENMYISIKLLSVLL
jgi:glutathionyl-hydroquinone reductase